MTMCTLLADTAVSVNLNLRVVALQDVLWNAKFVVLGVDRENGLGLRAEILDQTRAVEIIVVPSEAMLVGVLDDREHVLDGSWHYTPLFTGLTVQRVCLS